MPPTNHVLEKRLDRIGIEMQSYNKALKELVEHVKIQNGRVGKLEKLHIIQEAERAAKEKYKKQDRADQSWNMKKLLFIFTFVNSGIAILIFIISKIWR